MTSDEHTGAGEWQSRGGVAPWSYWLGPQAVRDDLPVNGRHDHVVERRRPTLPHTTFDYLHDVPAAIILDRLPIPMLAVGLDGLLTYANPAFAKMLGHAETATLIGRALPSLLAGRPAMPAPDWVTALRTGRITTISWSHADGFLIHTMISEPLLTRASDPVLLISVTDISDLIWNTAMEPH